MAADRLLLRRSMTKRARTGWQRIREVSVLPWSVVGRRRLWVSFRYRIWPLTFPVAALYRRTVVRRTRLVAVIGSFGKTTTTRAIAAVLGLPTASIRGWNGGGFLAEILLRIRHGSSLALTEVGIKHKGRMATYAHLLKPDLVVVTSIGMEHHRTLGSIHEIRAEKAEMLRHLPATGLAILNGDDPNVSWMRDHTSARVRTYGFGPSNDLYASNYTPRSLFSAQFTLHAEGKTRQVQTKLVGRHMVYGLLAAAAVGLSEGLDLEAVLQSIEGISPTPHRLQILQSTIGAGLMMDDYKMVFETVEKALVALAEIPARRKIVVLGEIYEPPKDEEDVYRDIGEQIAQIADTLVFVGEVSAYESLCEGAARGGTAQLTTFHANRSVHQAAEYVGNELMPQDLVLVKGLGSQRLDRIGLILTGQEVTCNRTKCKAPITVECSECPLLFPFRRGILGPWRRPVSHLGKRD